jgi:NADPH2:quinone reductase
MKAVLCERFCEPEDLVIGDAPSPKAGPGEVVVDVEAAGVNFADTLMIKGEYQAKPPFPFSPGLECAGTIREVGEGVTRFKLGDRVAAVPLGVGAFAEQMAADASLIFAIPPQMDFVTASGFCTAYGTSYNALKDRAQLKAGETLLVLGAAGGVGLTAVELGKVMGARVIAAASSDAKLELCKKYGADETINYTTQNLRDRLKEMTGGKGIDVVYDPVGGALADPAVRAMAPGGRFLVIGFASGEIPKIPLNLVLVKRTAIIGAFYGNWVRAEPEAASGAMRELMNLYVAGKLKPHVSKVFPMAQAGEALRYVSGRKAEGKVVVKMTNR